MSTTLRVAVITDAHGNSLALEAVVADLHKHAPDLILNLGDQVWGQVDPLAAYELQASLGAIEVRGNNDEKPFIDRPNRPLLEGRFVEWLFGRVPREALERLASLPVSATVLDGTLLAAHGTPKSPWENLLWEVEGDGLVPRPERDVLRDLAGVDETVKVVVVGHTHQERVLQLGGRLLVNVGPISWQADGDPRARWTLLERRAGRWAVEQRRVVYDWHAAASAVMAKDRVDPSEAALLTLPAS